MVVNEFKTVVVVDINCDLLDLYELNFNIARIRLETCITFSCFKEISNMYDLTLIICDLELPDSNPKELIEFAAKSSPQTPIWICTSDTKQAQELQKSFPSIKKTISKTIPMEPGVKNLLELVKEELSKHETSEINSPTLR